MARIVHARRELVDDQRWALAFALEHLHAEHADMAERLGDLAGDAASPRPQCYAAMRAGARLMARMPF